MQVFVFVLIVERKYNMADSPINYFGGKSRLASSILPTIPKHNKYCEVFAGGAWIFFRKEPSKFEAINDINNELINFYKCLQNHKDELLRCILDLPISRHWFQVLKYEYSFIKSLTDIQRASRFYYLMYNNYGAQIGNMNFTVNSTQSYEARRKRIISRINEASQRLENTVIENLHFINCIEKYNSEDTFLFIDPPYYGIEDAYGKNIFERTDYDIMAELLRNTKSKFLITLNNTPEVKKIFRNFIIKEYHLKYTANHGYNNDTNNELLISNYDFEFSIQKSK